MTTPSAIPILCPVSRSNALTVILISRSTPKKPVDGCPPICTPEYVFCTLYIAIAASHFNAVFRLLDFGQGSF